MRFTVLAMTLFVGACVADPTGTDGGGGEGGVGVGGGGGGGNTGGGGGGNTGGSGGSTMTGSMLPAELVGTWLHSESDTGIAYVFYAQGQVAYAGELSTDSGGCTFDVKNEYDGTVTLSGSVITITPTDGVQVTDDCGTENQDPYTMVEVDAFQVQGNTLSLHNQSTGVTLTLNKQ